MGSPVLCFCLSPLSFCSWLFFPGSSSELTCEESYQSGLGVLWYKTFSQYLNKMLGCIFSPQISAGSTSMSLTLILCIHPLQNCSNKSGNHDIDWPKLGARASLCLVRHSGLCLYSEGFSSAFTTCLPSC